MTVDQNNQHQYDEATSLTAMSLQRMIESTEKLTYLSLPERTALAQEIARVVPAGNVPSLITAALARLPGRSVPPTETRRNLALLIQGMQRFMDRAVYQAFFAGPAAVLAAYQMLLKMTGKDVDASFPEGTWQFYVEFGLREDTSRHTCETIGYQETLAREGLRLSSADSLAAWVYATAWLLRRYPDLLANEWMERVRLRHLEIALGAAGTGLLDRWLKARPYAAPDARTDFVEYRWKALNDYCQKALRGVKARRLIEREWADKQGALADELAAYQRQMSIHAYLNPGEHSDTRVPLAPGSLSVAVIVGRRYYLIDLAALKTLDEARRIVAGIMSHEPKVPGATLDRTLRAAHRREQPALRRLLPPETQAELDLLHTAPIIVNWDAAAQDLLAEIRAGQRGVGDHALTVFQTTGSMVFDLSHIFFDGAWGMAVAEMLTGQASHYARQLARMPSPKIDTMDHACPPGARCLALHTPEAVAARARKSEPPPEVSAESTGLRLAPILDLRRDLRKRNDAIRLTVNDFLVLYRTIFGLLYQPAADIIHALAALSSGADAEARNAAKLALAALDAARQPNPSLLIPLDASGVNPRERIFPTTFRNPFVTLVDQHRAALEAVVAFERGVADPQKSSGFFGKPLGKAGHVRETRLDYLATLQAFGELMRRYKDVSMQGESVSTAVIRLIGGLPPAVQRLLDAVPARFDVVNDIVKGQEVFSNVGQVAPGSSLTRFNTAKDDNEKKTLAWGVMTDARGVVHISLRDFRPHVAALVGVHHKALAARMTQDYLDCYVQGFNRFIEELLYITRARSQIE